VIAILVGFAPTAFWAWINHDNHILWLAISAFMLTRMIVLLAQLLGTTSDSTIDINQI
jgi:MATE family multidrug resistance protein